MGYPKIKFSMDFQNDIKVIRKVTLSFRGGLII